MTINPLTLVLENGAILRVHVLAPHTFRIRLRPDAAFAEPALVRYGVLHVEGDADVEFTSTEDAASVTVRTSVATLTIAKSDGRVQLRRADGTLLTQEALSPWSDGERGFGAEFTLADGEKLYGLGDVTRERIQKRGYRTMMWVRNVEAYVPIPYVMSTRGWALMLNTTWRHFFDLGATQPDRLRFWGERGELDYFLFVGDDLPSLLDRYTDVAGKPHVLPLWGYALTFVSNQQADAREMLDDCLNMRREDLPCDVIGLEPGWMETYYDYTVDKKWHPERFYIPYWAPNGPQTFLGAAERLGFKMSLWLCCDYDLSFEAERRAGAAGYVPPEEKARHADDFELDYHQHTPVMMDTLTKPEEPWFAHLKKFVDQGVSAFKVDGARQVNEHPDRKWGNGMDDEEMHNLYPTLLNQQMHVGFKEHTGRRPMVYSSGGYLGIQQFSATWAGDTGGGPKPLVSMLNHGLSGHSNVSCDMHVFSAEGIHFGFLQTWSQVCSWAYWRHPWLLGDKLLPIYRFYAKLRYRLLPYIYAAAHHAARTGLPVMRPMALLYLDDPRSDDLTQQYMLGDAFLVAAFTNRVHLPAGRWLDYWTGTAYTGPADVEVVPPAGRGGPLFVKAGAIIPTWPEMSYVGQKPVDTLGLHLYPPVPGTQSAFTLYEDDGESFDYLEGRIAITRIRAEATAGATTLHIHPRQGDYAGMPAARHFDVVVHNYAAAPASVIVDGQPLSPEAWRYDAAAAEVHLRVSEDPLREAARVVVITR